MQAYKSITIIAATLLISSVSMAQRATKAKESKESRELKELKTAPANSAPNTDAYLDSLKACRQRADSLMAANDSLRQASGYPADSRYYRYFAPLTFYPAVAGGQLQLGAGQPSDEERTLMHIYMTRPDLTQAPQAPSSSPERGSAAATEEQAPQRTSLTKTHAPLTPPERGDAAAHTPPLGGAGGGSGGLDMNLYVAKPSFWKFSGDYYLQFMQNHVSENWYKSGSNNYSMLGAVTLQYNYNNKQKIKWENKLEMKLGFITSEADTVNKFKSSEDLLRYTSKLGVQAHKNWYYTMQSIVSTQFTKGLKDNKEKVFSDFMSPVNINISLGMDYTLNVKNKLKGTAHIAPLAYNLKYCDRHDLAKSFGIEEGHCAQNDFGSQFTIEMSWTPWEMLKWQMRLYGFTTYHKFELECENTIALKFNKYISANLFLYPRFDDAVKRMEGHSFWQFKEYISVGFSYSM